MPMLFLLRHAKAAKASSGMMDFDRPLEPRGLSDIAGIGQAMRKRFPLPDRVLCSASNRTRQTLTGLGLPFRDEQIAFSRALYEAEADGYLEALRAETAGSVLLVGHNPATSDLANMLPGDGDEQARGRLAEGFPTSGLAVFEWDGDFDGLRPGHVSLRLFLAPERT